MKKTLFVVFGLALGSGLRAADAATLTWDNGANNMTWDAGASANWTGSAWANGSDAVFNAAGAGAITIAGGGVSAQSLTFNAGATGYSFSGGTLTLNNGGSITDNAAGTTVISSTVLDGGGTFTVAGSGDLTFSGAVGTSGVPNPTVTMNGSGALTFDGGANNFGCGVAANSGTVVLGKTSVVDTVCAIGTALTVAGATVQLAGSGGDQIFSGANVTVNSGTFDFNGRNEAFNGLSGTGGKIWNNGGGSSLMTVGSSNTGGTYSGTITDGSGTLAVTKLGTGVQYLDGNNGYSGQTTVSNGYLVPRHSNALGTGAGGAVVNSGATLQLESGITISGTTATITGNGFYDGSNYRGALASWSSNNAWTGPVVMTGTSRFVVQANTFTISGVISGAGFGLTKTYGGTLQLSGSSANTYSGDTTIVQGTLLLAKSVGNAISATVYIGDGTSAGSKFIVLGASDQIPDTATLTYNPGTNYGYFELWGYNDTVGGLADASGRGVTQLVDAENIGTASSTLTLAGSGAYSYNGYLRDKYTGTSGALSLIKSGSGTQTLSGANIYYTGATTVNGGNLRLTNTTAFASAIQIGTSATTTVSTANGTVDNWLYSKALTGTGTLVKDGTGWFEFDYSAPRDFAGRIEIRQGRLGSGMNRTDWSNCKADVVVSSGAQLDVRTDDVTIDELWGSGEVWNTFTVEATNTLTLGANNGSSQFGGAIRGAGGGTLNPPGATSPDGGKTKLVKLGTGTITLTGTNTYNGTTLISGGTLQIGNGGTCGTLGAGAVTDNATLTFNRSNAYAPANGIGGNGNLIQAGSGTLTLTGAGITYSGATTINAGRLALANTTGFISSTAINAGTLEVALSSDWTINTTALSITGTGTLIKSGGSTWYVGASGKHVNFNLTGGLIDIQGGKIQNNWNGTSFGGNQASVNIAGSAILDFYAENGQLDGLSGAGTLQNNFPGFLHGVTLGVAGGSGTFSGVIQDGPGAGTYGLALTKSGGGTQVLSGANTYTGTTLISGGTLQIGDGGTTGALGTGAVTDNATLAFNRSNAYAPANSIGGSGGVTQAGAGTLTLTGAGINCTGATAVNGGRLVLQDTTAYRSSTTTIASGKTLEFNYTGVDWTPPATIAFAGAGTFVKSGAGMMDVTWSGTVINMNFTAGALIDVQQGIIRNGNGYNKSSWDNNKASLRVAAGATFDVWDYGADLSKPLYVDALTGSGAVNKGWSGAAALTLGVNGGSGTFDGIIRNTKDAGAPTEGTLNLTKAGGGTQILNGANTYKGTTTVSGGTLLVNGSHAAGAAAYSVNAGTLGGTGTVWSAVSVGGLGALAPAGTNATGVFTIQNDVTLSSGAVFDVDIKGTSPGQAAGGYDQLVMAPGKTFNLGSYVAKLVLRVPQGLTLPLNQTFTLETGGTPNGYFQGLNDGAEILGGAYSFIIHYGPGAVITLNSRKVDAGTVFLVK